MSIIRITAVGLNDWELNFLQATVGIASGTDIGTWSYVTDPAGADVVLANDADRNGAAWLQRSANDGHPSRPVVVGCVERSTGRAPGVLRTVGRPIGYAELISVLRAVEMDLRTLGATHSIGAVSPGATQSVGTASPGATQSVGSASPGAAQKVGTASPGATQNAIKVPGLDEALAHKARRSMRFFEGTRFLGLARRALASGRITEISHPRFPTVTIFPGAHFYACAVDPATLPEVFRAPAMEFASREFEGSDVEESNLRLPSQPVVQLLYCAARFGSEGRLSANGNVDDLLELLEEPDFRSLPSSEEDQVIVRHLRAGPVELKDIAALSGLHLESIIEFLNACEAIGLIRRHPRAGEPVRLADVIDASSGAIHASAGRKVASAFERLRALSKSILTGIGKA
jgi:hypothetical protein